LGALPVLGRALAEQAAAGARMKLRVSVGPYLAMSPFFTAYESGYFAREGFDIELNRGPSSVQVIPVIAGGRLDVCFLSDHAAILNAVARGARIRIVAGREIASAVCRPIAQIYVRRDRFPNGISDLRPLKGAPIGVSGYPANVSAYMFETMLRHDGMSLSDVEVRRTEMAESIPALLSGSVTAILRSATETEGHPAMAQLAKGPTFGSVEPDFEYSWILFGPRLLDGDVQNGARFLRAYLHGARDFLDGKTPAFLDDLARSEGTDPKILRGECRQTFVPDGSIRIADLERFVRWAAVKGLSPTTLRATDLVDARFLAAMNGGLQ
jgi:NitT/TauT family transport system substrate-binding protein